jgi:hypothetical protein
LLECCLRWNDSNTFSFQFCYITLLHMIERLINAKYKHSIVNLTS